MARGVRTTLDDAQRGPMATLASPLRLGGTPATLRRRSPEIDEHGSEIRAWLRDGSSSGAGQGSPSDTVG